MNSYSRIKQELTAAQLKALQALEDLYKTSRTAFESASDLGAHPAALAALEKKGLAKQQIHLSRFRNHANVSWRITARGSIVINK